MQLELANTGYGSPARPTGRRVELFADWIEAHVVAREGPVAKPELVDLLDNAGMVLDNDDGWQLVNDAFARCRSRMRNMGQSYPFVVAGSEIDEAHEALPYRFCLLASLPEQLQVLRSTYPTAFRDLFEEVTAEALKRLFPSWEVVQTGWSTIAAEGRGSVIQMIADRVRARTHDPRVFPHANDAQVDIAAFRPFRDSRAGYPVLLGQCATGVNDWRDKAIRPNLDRWIKAVQFSATPQRLFAVPFSLDDETFYEASFECSGLLLDRNRICENMPSLPADLHARVSDWLTKAQRALPLAA